MQALAKDDASASPVEVRNLHRRYGKGFPDWPSKDMLTSMRQKCVARPR